MRVCLERKHLLLFCAIAMACGPVGEHHNLSDQKKLSPATENPAPQDKPADHVTPTEWVAAKSLPRFDDDLNFDLLDLAMARQLKRFSEKDLNETISFGGKNYRLSRMQQTLVKFSSLVHKTQSCLKKESRDFCFSQFNGAVVSGFDIFRPKLAEGDPRFGNELQTLFTAYYTPLISGALTKTEENPYAIYSFPNLHQQQKLARNSIDFHEGLASQSLEIFYSPSLFDLYLLQVQGGGKINYSVDGKLKSKHLIYDGENGLSWKWISSYMLKQEYIKDASVDAQRKYLESHPEKQEEIFSYCPSYVFFKTSDEPPTGSDGVSLTDGRSIATDNKYYSVKGGLAFVQSRRPKSVQDHQKISFSRFVIDQDTGGAINGKARVDFYHGEGAYAELAAYSTKDEGNIFFLVARGP